MKIRAAVAACLTTLSLLPGAASAAEFEYVFLNKVLNPGYSLDREGTPATTPLDAPFANLSVADETEGIRITFSTTGSVSGKISFIAFNFLPELSSMTQGYTEGAYFYTDYTTALPYDFVASYGELYANEDVSFMEVTLPPNTTFTFPFVHEGASPSFFYFGLDTTTVLSDNFTMHFRGLPETISATDIVPRYASVIDATYGSVDDAGRAVILASPVPEASTGTLLLIGLGALSLVARRQSPPR